MKNWTIIFRILANINRLSIIKMLIKNRELTVSEISKKLNISMTATSNHLITLKDLDVLNNRGKNNNVYYSINPKMPKDFKDVISLVK